ncbi:MAG: pitrilysin family protein [Burkholderiaceae bacterium]
MTDLPCEPDTAVHTLANGVRVIALPSPHLDSASVSVFVRTGSRNESARLAGISHFVEHMAFKGTHARDCRQINLDAERLGAEVNAHTDKDHTAYHMLGRARDAGAFVQMLGDIVCNSSFPEAEIERERQVILQEYIEDEDDPLSTAFKLFDAACYANHALARPVIGTRAGIERLARADLLDYVARQYGASNVVVGVAGRIDPETVLREVEAAFGSMPRGVTNVVDAPAYVGGARTRRVPGSSQSHVVLGYPTPTLLEGSEASVVAAAVFGEGMSSPLMHELRERRGLVYYAGCSADVNDLCGQFVIEASTTPEHLDEFFTEVMRLLRRHADGIDAESLARARNQIAVRRLREQERGFRRLEDAAQDLYVHGRVRSPVELEAAIQAVSVSDVRDAFQRMLGRGAAVALAGKVPPGSREKLQALAVPQH